MPFFSGWWLRVWGVVWLLLSLDPLPARAQGTVLRGGWYFDSENGQVIENSSLVIAGGKFLEVGADLAGRDLSAMRVVELSQDDYIVPGIFDLHAHYNVNLFGRRRRTEFLANPAIFLANGVTSTFPAGELNPTAMLETRKRIDNGKQEGPRIFNSGPYFGGARRDWNADTTAEQIYREVDFWAGLGVRGFKAKGIRPLHLRALIDRAHQHGLTVTGHLDSGYRDTVNPRDAILMGIDRIEHFLGGGQLTPDRPAYASLVTVSSDSAEFRKIAGLFIKYRVFFDATVAAYGYAGERGDEFDHWTDEKRFFTPHVRKHLDNRAPRVINRQFENIYRVKRETVRAFHAAGGLITLGTDHPSRGDYLPGFAAHRELHVLVLAGIPPGAALKIATLNGARALNVGDKLGSIEPGKFADLFVIKGDPLRDIRNTRNVLWVMKSGRLYDPQALLKSVEGRMGPRTPEEAKVW